MKLDRNTEGNEGRGKYALLKLRELERYIGPGTFGVLDIKISRALAVLEKAGILDQGVAGSESEFFLIRLKDKYALDALTAYADAAESDDAEYAGEIRAMLPRAGRNSKFCKRPD